MGPFRVQEDVAVVVHVDRPDHARVVLAGVHEVPDHPARLVLVDCHKRGALLGPVSFQLVQDFSMNSCSVP